MEGDLGFIDTQRLETVPEEAEAQADTALPANAAEVEDSEPLPDGGETGAETAETTVLSETEGGVAGETVAESEENDNKAEKFGNDGIVSNEANEASASKEEPAPQSKALDKSDHANIDFPEATEGYKQPSTEVYEDTAASSDGIGKRNESRKPSVAEALDAKGTGNNLIREPKETLSEMLKVVSLKIQTQNNVINNLKDKIRIKAVKFPRTLCESNEIRNLNICIQEESKKLHCLLRQAMSLHKSNPNRKWSPIELATTYIEDCKPIAVNIWKPIGGCQCNGCIGKGLSSPKCSSLYTSESSSDKSGSTNDRFGRYFVNLQPEKRKSYEHKPREKDPLFVQLRPENRRAYSLDPKKRLKPRYVNNVNTNVRDTRSRKMSANHIIKCIQQKVENIQNELLMWERARPETESSQTAQNDKPPKNSTHWCGKGLEDMLSRLQNILECDAVEKTSDLDNTDTTEKTEFNYNKQFGRCVCGNALQKREAMYSNQSDYADLKGRYCELLDEYRRKEQEVTKLSAQVSDLKIGHERKNHDVSEGSTPEVRLLRKKLQQYQEDNEDYKILVCEQARQIDDYRAKYLASLQKIEEQTCILQKMEIDNRRVEHQINCEIQQIKDKFQHKINEYSKLPELLENEQIKLAECSRQRDDLETKLHIVCRELKSVKAAQNQRRTDTEDPERCKKLSNELSNLRQKYDLLKESRDDLSNKYDKTCREFGLLRSESAKIICRMRERAKMNQSALQRHIDDLEKELAKCRAAACLSMADREAIIKDMQAQLNCLTLSFDSSQKQIKTLKDHIAYISGGKTNSIVICCEPNKVR